MEHAVPTLPLDDENLPLFTVGQVAGIDRKSVV